MARDRWENNAELDGAGPPSSALSALVAFSEPDGIIGRGTFIEIVDAVEPGCEVWIAAQPDRWWPPNLVDAPPCLEDSARRYARLMFPAPFPPGRGRPGPQ